MAERAMQTNFSNLVYNLKFDGIICKVLLEVREHQPANVLQLRWKRMIKKHRTLYQVVVLWSPRACNHTGSGYNPWAHDAS